MRTNKNINEILGSGYLKYKHFKQFLDKHKFIRAIELSRSGEIFLNPELADIIKYAYEKGVVLTADNGVNFNNVSDETLEALVKYRFRSMTISLDGASQEIYSVYRVNGDFNKVIDNIKRLNRYKEAYKSDYPKLLWQYILMEHNECDIAEAKRLAQELKMTIYFKLTWDVNYKPHDSEMIKRETGLKFLSREEVLANSGKLYSYAMCYQLWNSPQINWDGRLLGCCSASASVLTNTYNGIDICYT
jgi:MoaA/NifB/PqqE/SkfB family radical SAM enzyme